MSRLYDPRLLVKLPNRGVDASYAFAVALIAAASGHKKLPASIVKALERVKVRARDLRKMIEGRPSAESRVERKTADRAEDAAWRALHQLASAWAAVDGPQGDAARAVKAALFADGLRFTRLPYAEEWAWADRMIARIVADELDAKIEAIGGGAILAHLRAAHRAYGEALGITAPKGAPLEVVAGGESPSVQKQLQALSDALRTYVLRVAAHVDEDDPESAELAGQLLQPLGEARRAKSAARKPAPPADRAAASAA